MREQAQAERADIVEEARSEAQAQVAEMLAAAEARLATERQQTILALRNEIGELAMTLSERIVHESLQQDARQRKLVEDFIAGVGAAERRPSRRRVRGVQLMQGASRKSLSGLRDRLPTDGDLAQLSEQLYAVVSMLTVQGSLRRALSDPASDGGVEGRRRRRVVRLAAGPAGARDRPRGRPVALVAAARPARRASRSSRSTLRSAPPRPPGSSTRSRTSCSASSGSSTASPSCAPR